MPDSMKSCLMHILLIQESDFHMSTRLIIDGNAVYEIDEDCQECQKKASVFREGKPRGNRRLPEQRGEAQKQTNE